MRNADAQTYVRTILIVLTITLIAVYALFQARNLLTGPVIEITKPQNGSTVHNQLIIIEGVGSNIAEITLNDRSIVIDEKGHFSEELLLSPGYTIMNLSARDRFGRTTSQSLELFYKL